MENYPNMSYCMFENTTAALNQCLQAMIQAEEVGLSMEDYYNGLSSEYEKGAFKNLQRLVCDFLDHHDAWEGK